MIEFFSGFNAIPFDWLFTNTTFFSHFLQKMINNNKICKKIVKSLLDYDDTYCPILFTIRFSIFFKEFAVNPFFTNATFKAFFMVHFTKGSAAFHTNGLLTYSTFSWKNVFKKNVFKNHLKNMFLSIPKKSKTNLKIFKNISAYLKLRWLIARQIEYTLG